MFKYPFAVSEQFKQWKKLWRSIATLLGSNTSRNQIPNQPTAEDLLRFFSSKVASVRQATEGMPAESNLPSSPAVFDSFEPCAADEIGKIISATPTKSCSVDPLPTQILKEFLSEVLPFIVNMCNTSHEEGCLPLSQRHAIVSPHVKKAGADQSDVKKLSFYFKSDVNVKNHRKTCLPSTRLIAGANGLMPGLQSTYRRGHSTEIAVLIIISFLLIAVDRGQVTILGLLDLSVAFDIILINRLRHSFGIQGVALS